MLWVKLPTWFRIVAWIFTVILSLVLFRTGWWFFRWVGWIIVALSCFWTKMLKWWEIAGCVACAIWIVVLISELFSEYSYLEDYTIRVKKEERNRVDILNKYTERDENMSRIIELEKDIITYAKKMLNTDCVNKTTCNDADIWNSLWNQLDEAFDEKDRIWEKSQTAISKQNQVKMEKKLWLLDLLWMDNSTELSDSLNSYSSFISSKKSSINSKIDQIDTLEADCDYSPVITCTHVRNILEKEY